MRDTKKIPLKAVPLGTKFSHLITANSSRMADFQLIKINGAFATLTCYGTAETVSTENAFIEVPLSESEFKAKYKEEAKKIVKAIKNEVPFEPECIGSHEIWNSWIDVDPYQMASNCLYENITVIGFCYLRKESKFLSTDTVLDIGIVAEDESGERFWCHSSSKWFEGEEWEELS